MLTVRSLPATMVPATVIALTILAGAAGWHALAADKAPTPDPFLALNNEFHAIYQRAQKETLRSAGPLILVDGDKLILIHETHREEAEVVPSLYHNLKMISHLPLSIDITIAPFGDGPIDVTRLEELKTLRGLAARMREDLDNRGFSAGQVQRQQTIFRESLAYLDRLIERKSSVKDERIAYTRAMGPLLLTNADEAARAAIDAYLAQTSTWRDMLPPEDWQRLRVIVIGPQMPRENNLAVQFFAHLLGVPGEGRRIVYAESLYEEPRALDLLATHLLDSRFSEDFFNDPNRMDRDLLGDAATAYLQTLDRSEE